MDQKDRKILGYLQEDASLSLNDLAEKVDLSPSPCWKRVRKLEEDGVIRKRVALVDQDKLGLPLSVFVLLKTCNHNEEWLEHFADKASSFDEVVELYRMGGDWDYMMRVVVKNIHAYDQFYKKLIKTIPDLCNVSASFAMEQIKYTTALPL
ncbi:Lrp/AsnC family transcriptional regulator [Sansalvadorimonas sp. 2012CJ34-2]|uniref:Lrp/AsnC family transcriptional regulator n=1 Tax=Parendozoicomonas callyspongiae TaxID=2942213 RepID=A0ABT0PEE8_9GAMM|nr:Lrp/AsnC family transcriptional regulator [Sansalvadorimonas sp. 2012CJ34-2]MCL6269742.1 Lrp/AsnC family transcriptional regulator [Sansalvadorimonas sp. 2012CJ34-2]